MMISTSKQQATLQIWRVARLVIGIALLLFLFSQIEWSQLGASWRRLDWRWVLLAFLTFPALIVISTFRWGLLLKVQKVSLPFLSLMLVYVHSMFLMLTIPSFIGADAGRSWEIRRHTGKSAEGTASVLLERLLGFHAMLLIGLIAVWFRPTFAEYSIIRWLVTGLFIAVSTMILVALELRRFRWLVERISITRLQAFLLRLQDATNLYQKHLAVLFNVWLISILVQACSILAIYCLTFALNYQVSLIDVAAVASLIAAISAVPISPGALGLQESSYVVLMGSMGVGSADALTISLFMRVFMIMIALLGGLDFIWRGSN